MATAKAHATQDITSAAGAVDLGRFVLILGNFNNLPDVAKRSENHRFIFEPPTENHNWKGTMTGEVWGPFLALEFGKDMYNPDGWMVGSSDDTDRCDVQVAVAGDESGVSRQHLRIELDVESNCPRLTQFTDRNPLAIIVHEERENRKLLLTQNKSVRIETSAPITVNFGTCSFQAWRPILSPEESRSFHRRLEKHFKDYLDTMPVFPSIRPLSGAETFTIRFGKNGAVYRREGDLGKGASGTVYRVVEVTSKKIFAAKEPFFKASDSRTKLVAHFKRLQAEYDKLVELKHPYIVEAVELLLVADNRQLPPWMIMEYIEDSLDSVVAHLDHEQCFGIVPQLIEAVEFMHAKNYVHRDIKPGNILIQWINGQPVPKVADVGTMKEADKDLKTFVGTPLYMAPECWSTNRGYGKEVDMWAVGLVLLQLFTDWDPTTDDAWVDGPFGKSNRLGFSAWISKTLMPLIAKAPESAQELLRGLICESPGDRWTAHECQTWAIKHLVSPLDSGMNEHKRTRELDPQELRDEAEPRKVRSGKLDVDRSLPDTLPWGTEYRLQDQNS